MIRINLLPTKRKKKSKPMPMYLIYSGVALAASLAVFMFATDYMKNRIEELNKDKANKEAKLKDLKKLIKDVEDFEAKKKVLENKVRVILAIAEQKSLPAKLFNDLSYKLNQVKGAWIVNMKFVNGKVQLSGVAYDNNDAVNFRNKLAADDELGTVNFKSVRLPGTQKVSLKGNTVFNFNMTMEIELKKPIKGGTGNGS